MALFCNAVNYSVFLFRFSLLIQFNLYDIYNLSYEIFINLDFLLLYFLVLYSPFWWLGFNETSIYRYEKWETIHRNGKSQFKLGQKVISHFASTIHFYQLSWPQKLNRVNKATEVLKLEMSFWCFSYLTINYHWYSSNYTTLLTFLFLFFCFLVLYSSSVLLWSLVVFLSLVLPDCSVFYYLFNSVYKSQIWSSCMEELFDLDF